MAINIFDHHPSKSFEATLKSPSVGAENKLKSLSGSLENLDSLSFGLDEITLLSSSSPPLTHLNKSRPRRTKASSRFNLSESNMEDDIVVAECKKVGSTPFRNKIKNESMLSTISHKKEMEESKTPLPIIRTKIPPELPATRPKYTPKSNALSSFPVTKIEKPVATLSDSTPLQSAPTPMRRHIPPGTKGIIVPSMEELKAKRNTMRHVPNELSSQVFF